MLHPVLFFILFNSSATIFIFAGGLPIQKKLCNINELLLSGKRYSTYHNAMISPAFKNVSFGLPKFIGKNLSSKFWKLTYTKTKKTSLMYVAHDDKSLIQKLFLWRFNFFNTIDKWQQAINDTRRIRTYHVSLNFRHEQTSYPSKIDEHLSFKVMYRRTIQKSKNGTKSLLVN